MMLLSFLAGYFEYTFILIILIIVHELGHLIMISFLGYKIDKVIIYPFGGLTKYNAFLNSSIIKEFIILISGPLLQFIFFLIVYLLYKLNFVNDNTYNLVKNIHHILLFFNFLPIIPLDGSKLINLVLDYIFSYKNSHIITIIISIITIPLIILFDYRLLIIFLIILLIKSIIFEINNHKYKINKFLLERYLYDFKYKLGKVINNIYDVKRCRVHKIKKDNIYKTEKECLKEMFD